MKKLFILLAAPLLSLGLSATALADERPAHFKGEKAETFEEALAHLSSYNAELQTILAKGELGPEDTAKIHQITYTLENALERISEDVEEMQETLEELHVASERYQVDVVRTQGREYLEAAEKLTR